MLSNSDCLNKSVDSTERPESEENEEEVINVGTKTYGSIPTNPKMKKCSFSNFFQQGSFFTKRICNMERLNQIFNEVMESFLGPAPEKEVIVKFESLAPITEIPTSGLRMPFYTTDNKLKRYCIVHGKRTFNIIRSPLKLILSKDSTEGDTNSPILKIISKEKRFRFITRNDRFLVWVCIYSQTNSPKGKKKKTSKIHFLTRGKWFKTPRRDYENPSYPYSIFECKVPKYPDIPRSNSKQWNTTFTLVKKRITTISGETDYHPTEYVPVLLYEKGNLSDFTIFCKVWWRHKVSNESLEEDEYQTDSAERKPLLS